MRNTQYFKNKKITIVGIARSGLACANLLAGLGADISLTDSSDNETTRLNVLRLKFQDIKVELGRHSPELIKGRDIIVVSPGVPDTALPVIWANDFKIPVISEIEVAWILCPATVIAITGTNGKTTVTTLIGEVLKAKGKKAFVCGNIGRPFCAEVDKVTQDDFVSLEVSSFQLERILTFKPKISVVLNLSRNHLDRYSDMEAYLKAKKRILMNQDSSDYAVLNFEDDIIRGLAADAKAQVAYFSKDNFLNLNQAAVMAVGSILGIGKDLILNVFREFKGVEHRLEEVAQINNIKFINDSKATTVDATVWALQNLDSPIVLIAGGREKGNDYSTILDLARKKVKKIILLGEAREKMAAAFGPWLAVEEAVTLPEAVARACASAVPGDCILLSPMCKSFDMFADYEERGRVFKQAVRELAVELNR
jgi:UDP-N-acetylmuramoylalanine--D-glutamate ligase